MASVEVSLFDAKTHLSRLVDRAERGDVVTITRRGRPVARLVPAHDSVEKVDRRVLLRRLRSFRARVGGCVDVRALVRQGRRA